MLDYDHGTLDKLRSYNVPEIVAMRKLFLGARITNVFSEFCRKIFVERIRKHVTVYEIYCLVVNE